MVPISGVILGIRDNTQKALSLEPNAISLGGLSERGLGRTTDPKEEENLRHRREAER